jgi:hypothetical protein
MAAREGGATILERARRDEAIVAALGDKLDAIFDDEAVLGRVGIFEERLLQTN